MAQRISQMPMQALPTSQEGFIGSSVNRGLGAMTQPNPGMKGQNDGGSYTDLTANPQFERNNIQQLQSIQQNGMSASPQMQAQAAGQVTNAMTQKSTAQYQAERDKNTYVANIMEATGNSMATKQLGDPVTFQVAQNNVLLSRQMGTAPDLTQVRNESQRYG